METLGQRLRAARAAAGLSRRQLFEQTKIGYSTIAEIENGGMRTTTKLHTLARALNVSDEWLATGRGPRERGTSDAAPPPSLRPDQRAILDLWEALDPDGRKAIQTVGHALAQPPLKRGKHAG